MIYLILLISFFLDGIVSFIFNNNILFNPLFSLMSLIIVFKYYKKREDLKYLITIFMVGLLVDIVYADTLFLNAGIYLIIGIIVIKYYKFFTYNLLNSIILGFIIISLYRLLSFLVLSNMGVISVDFYKLIESIYSSLFLNLIYISCFFLKRKKYKKYLEA